MRAIERESGRGLDLRRFRPNVVLDTTGADPFEEDSWVGRTLMFGEGSSGPAVTVTLRDERCAMVNLDPDTADSDPEVMKSVVRMNGNYAGVYCTVVREGDLGVGQRATLQS